jgi:hypothetical protein
MLVGLFAGDSRPRFIDYTRNLSGGDDKIGDEKIERRI